MGRVLKTACNPYQADVTQKYPLGVEAADKEGRIHVYCEFIQDTGMGVPVEDLDPADLITGGYGTVTANAAIGTRSLSDTGEFASKDLRGAYGEIAGDTVANGVGQLFWIDSHDDNTLQCVVDYGFAANVPIRQVANAGWGTALVAASSTYQLWLPGRVQTTTGQPNMVRGVPQIDIDVSAAAFAWALRDGVGVVRQNVDSTDVPVNREPVRVATARVDGLTTGGTTADEVNYQMGSWPMANLQLVTGTDDVLRRVPVFIPSRGISKRNPLDWQENALFSN